MNRLTKKSGEKYVLPQGKGSFRRIAERLAAYENTGLEPSEIEQLMRSNSDIQAKTFYVTYHINGEYTISVVALSGEEAVKKARETLRSQSFSPITDVSSRLSSVRDIEGNYYC